MLGNALPFLKEKLIFLDMQVKVIVMITDLVEVRNTEAGNFFKLLHSFSGVKVKAHQYWPDKNNPILLLEGGMKVNQKQS